MFDGVLMVGLFKETWWRTSLAQLSLFGDVSMVFNPPGVGRVFSGGKENKAGLLYLLV